MLVDRFWAGQGLGACDGEADMTDVPMKSMWMGRDIDTLSREELIDVIHYMARELDASRECAMSILRVQEAAKRARYGA